MNRKFIQRVLLFAFLYYAFCLGLDALFFLLSHIPGAAARLDPVILGLGELAGLLAWPRVVLRHLWPMETTPTALEYILPLLNCLIWGLLLAGLKTVWNHVRK